MSAVLRYNSGEPLNVTCNQNQFGAGGSWCSLNPGVPLKNPAWNSSNAVAYSVPYLNRAAWFQPPNMTYGNAPARIAQLRGPGIKNEDIAIMKTFSMGESRRMELRASAFNAFNRHLLGNPDQGYNSATFGMIINPQSNTPRQIQMGAKFYF